MRVSRADQANPNRHMRIGFDVDGVLACFDPAYTRVLAHTSGRTLIPPGFVPDCWDFDVKAGYTPAEIRTAFDVIHGDPSFWSKLSTHGGIATVAHYWHELMENHEIYFITNRRGVRVKAQTEAWLCGYLYPNAGEQVTVLISANKGQCAQALSLDAYIDDKPENVLDVAILSPYTKPFLLTQPWNTAVPHSKQFRRVESVEDFLLELGIYAA